MSLVKRSVFLKFLITFHAEDSVFQSEKTTTRQINTEWNLRYSRTCEKRKTFEYYRVMLKRLEHRESVLKKGSKSS